MIFYNPKTEKELMIENAIQHSDFIDGIVLESYYNEQIMYITEGNVTSNELGLTKDPNPRFILIGRSSKGKHNGRIKVSGRTKSVNDVGKYVSFFVSNEKKGIVEIEGDIRSIKMSSAEVSVYKEFCLRHNNLIQLVDKYPELENYIEVAIIRDERSFRSGIPYKRDKNGNLYYDVIKPGKYGRPETHNIVENIKGEIINDIIS